MKNIYFLFVFLVSFLPLNLLSQNDTIWYDSNWKNTDKKTASFYRTDPQKKGNMYLQIDYYLSGSKQMEAYSNKKDEPNYQGEVKWYFENGEIYQKVHYTKGVLNGNRKVYFDSGKIKNERFYVNGKMHGNWTDYYENGKVKEKGAYEDDQKEGMWETFYSDGKLKSKGKYVFDKKIDIWTINYYDGTKENE